MGARTLTAETAGKYYYHYYFFVLFYFVLLFFLYNSFNFYLLFLFYAFIFNIFFILLLFPASQLPPRGAGPVPILLCLFFLFSFALPRYVGSFVPFGKSEVFRQFRRCSVGVVPHVDVFLMYLWGGR